MTRAGKLASTLRETALPGGRPALFLVTRFPTTPVELRLTARESFQEPCCNASWEGQNVERLVDKWLARVGIARRLALLGPHEPRHLHRRGDAESTAAT